MPDISDVHDFCHAIESLGGTANYSENTLEIDIEDIRAEQFDDAQISRTRASIYFAPGLLHHFGQATLPFPGGDKIGKRSIDEHIDGFIAMGYDHWKDDDTFTLIGPASTADVEVNCFFRVGATVNMILAAVMRDGVTTISLAAFEPHIFCLIDFFRAAGADIQIKYDHTIIIHGGKKLTDEIQFEVISDYLQSGTFAIIGALCAETYLDIHRARIADLTAFLYKLHEAWVQTEDLGNDTLRVHRAKKLKTVNIQTNIFPGFPTDLQPLFSILMTQCDGESIIHENMYEWRLGSLVEYELMGGKVIITNNHEARIQWPTPLHGAQVSSWDLRAGSAMVIAGMIASGTTNISNVYWIHRGYENLIGKLQEIGVDISEVERE